MRERKDEPSSKNAIAAIHLLFFVDEKKEMDEQCSGVRKGKEEAGRI